jgi:UDP-N-acetylglucosamine transferase subunit ALG13
MDGVDPVIFVTVGTQLPFDRMLQAVDEWAGAQGIRGFAQIGPSRYRPRNLEHAQFVDAGEFVAHVRAADCIIAHAGMGTILTSLTHAKPAILVPRIAALGEHRNEHQLATARKFGEYPMIKIANDAEELAQAYAAIMQGRGESAPRLSPHASPEFIAALRKLIF